MGLVRQFKSEHLEGGTEQFYFALVHGAAQVPRAATERTTFPGAWKVEPYGAFPFTHGAVEGFVQPGGSPRPRCGSVR